MLLGEDERLVKNSVAETVDVEVDGKETVVSTMMLPAAMLLTVTSDDGTPAEVASCDL